MSKQPRLFYLILLMVAGMVGILAAAENSDDVLSITVEVTDEKIIENGNVSETVPKKNVSTVTTKEKMRSIKMIVGGQSEGGLAKQVTLPVDD
jgi:hypothetical protein